MKGGQGQGKEEVRREGLEFAGRQSTDTFCSAFVLLVSLLISLSPPDLAGHGRELPHSPTDTHPGGEQHQSRAAAADL